MAPVVSSRDPIMVRSLIHSDEKLLSLRMNYRPGLVVTGKGPHSFHRIKPKNGHKFYFVTIWPDKQFCAVISINLSSYYAGKNFAAKHLLVSRRVHRFRPAMPHSGNHCFQTLGYIPMIGYPPST